LEPAGTCARQQAATAAAVAAVATATAVRRSNAAAVSLRISWYSRMHLEHLGKS